MSCCTVRCATLAVGLSWLCPTVGGSSRWGGLELALGAGNLFRPWVRLRRALTSAGNVLNTALLGLGFRISRSEMVSLPGTYAKVNGGAPHVQRPGSHGVRPSQIARSRNLDPNRRLAASHLRRRRRVLPHSPIGRRDVQSWMPPGHQVGSATRSSRPGGPRG